MLVLTSLIAFQMSSILCLESSSACHHHHPLLTLEGPRRWFADLHRNVCVQRIPLDLNQSVGQRADAVLLHCVLCVLNFIKSDRGEEGSKEGERKGKWGKQ